MKYPRPPRLLASLVLTTCAACGGSGNPPTSTATLDAGMTADGSHGDSSTADAYLSIPPCGNGKLDHSPQHNSQHNGTPEQCDDGNLITGDGCSHTCMIEQPSTHADTIQTTKPNGTGTRNHNNAINGVRGAGSTMGSFDVLSLDNTLSGHPSATFRWGAQRVLNGPGVDFVVFENGFEVFGTAGNPQHFMDPMVVELSVDGQTWVTFPHDYTHTPETSYSRNPNHWIGFAGTQPVRLNRDTHPVDPFDPAAAGGDGFDLEQLPTDSPEAREIRSKGFVWLRLTSAGVVTNPDTNNPFPQDFISNGPDIDGIIARYLVDD